MREIRKIEPKATSPAQRKRVAAYARVSSPKEAMLHSLSAQISHYNGYIGRRGDWEFAGIYADEGISGAKDTRPEFQRMLTDCRAGKIDMIITKSVTRFARNTVTLLETVRELKLLGIDVFFEKEDIRTMSADGEFMLTILASFAQEESRSASENQKWRIQKMFAEGRPNTGRMLGYRLVEGVLRIVPEEAEIVKQIFRDYLSGMGRNAIMKKLFGAENTTIRGKKRGETAISAILRNEKYTGDMLLQKTCQLDHISKKRVRNHGEQIMYHIENSHEAIISKETFAAVQQEIARRAKKYRSNPPAPRAYPFTGIIRCGYCGKHYHRKIAIAGTKYAKPVWICYTFDTRGKDNCPSQQIPENILISKTLGVMGITELDSDSIRKRVAVIHIPAHNTLVYEFTDGHTEEVSWQTPSRRESWTEEMKQVARKRQIKINERRRQNERAED